MVILFQLKKNTMSLIKKLKLVESVSVQRWSMVQQLVNVINSGDAVVLEKKWFDNYKQNNLEHYPLDLSKISTWSTQDYGINLKFYYNESLFCKSTISDVNNYRTFNNYYSRFEALLKLNDSFINELEGAIESRFDVILEREYEDELERQKKEWINKRKEYYEQI